MGKCNIKMGIGCEIHPTVTISKNAVIELGDHVYIGENVNILDGFLKIGDYSKIHKNTYIKPTGGIVFGHLTWIGQNCILDGTGGIKSGNFLGVGMGSSLYSHIRHGDVLEGCNYNKDKKLLIGDDVWFVGQCLVSPIIAHNKSMAMLGSVVTKDMEYNCIYGGNPSKLISDKIGHQYKKINPEQKITMMENYIKEYFGENKALFNFIPVLEYPLKLNENITYYNVLNRTYTKTNNVNEIKFNKWLFKYKAKFIPIDNFKYENNNSNNAL